MPNEVSLLERISPWLLLGFVLAAGLGWLALAPDLLSLTASQGSVDLPEAYRDRGPVVLRGEWEYYPSEFLAPEDVESSQPQFVELPGVMPELRRADVYGTFRLAVQLPEAGSWSVRIPFFLTAYRLFINGEEVGQVGEPGLAAAETVPHFFQSIHTHQTDSSKLDIVVHAANFHLYRSIVPPVILGRPDQVQTHHTRSVGRSLMLVGSLVVIGLLHLLIFGAHPTTRSALPFGALCLLMALRELLYGEMYMTALFPGMDLELYIRLASLTYYIAVPATACYVRAVVPDQLPAKHVHWVWFASLPAIALALLTPHRIYSHLAVPMHVLLFVVLLLISRTFYRYARGGGQLAFHFVFAWASLAVAAVYDLLYDAAIVSRGPLLPLALLVFALVQAFYLFTRLSETLREANLDHLTRLPNRRSLSHHGAAFFAESEAAGTPLSVLMFDLDLLKQINDTWGHQTGDKVLEIVAKRALNAIRQDDRLFRYGGDEFAVLLPDTDLAAAAPIAERIRHSVSSSPVAVDGDTEVAVAASVGVATKQAHTQSVDELLGAADHALYQAKTAGGNRVQLNQG